MQLGVADPPREECRSEVPAPLQLAGLRQQVTQRPGRHAQVPFGQGIERSQPEMLWRGELVQVQEHTKRQEPKRCGQRADLLDAFDVRGGARIVGRRQGLGEQRVEVEEMIVDVGDRVGGFEERGSGRRRHEPVARIDGPARIGGASHVGDSARVGRAARVGGPRARDGGRVRKPWRR
ncbi:MAG: hypothetical protein R3E12_09765, partial [Candidatus Eisenbacteria bacterium]